MTVQQAQAKEAAQPAVQETQLTAEQWVERGLKLSENSDEEIACYTYAMRLNPSYAAAYNNRENARADKGDLDGALTDYDQAIRLDPKDASIYYNRGNALYNKDDFEGALADYNESIRLKPAHTSAYTGLENCYYTLKQWREALAAYERCLTLPPGKENRDWILKTVEELRRKVP